MYQRTTQWLLLLVVALFVAVGLAMLQDRAAAQDNGSRPAGPDADRRGGWGRNRGPEGERRRERGLNRSEQRPTESRRQAPSTNSPTLPTASSSDFGTTSEAEKIRQRATDLIRSHDKNGNGLLEGDELAALGMSKGADSNGDATITHNELVAFYSPKSRADPTSQTTTAKPSASQVAASGQPGAATALTTVTKRKIVNNARKSYRFKTNKERLPTWRFASKDTNGDGQVSMSEYSNTWNDRTAAEFQRYDRNNDGMITTEEAK